MRQCITAIVHILALLVLAQCCYAGIGSDKRAVSEPLLTTATTASATLDVTERLVGRWSGSLPKWMCNLFATLLPFYGCEGEVRFHDDGSLTTRSMYLTDFEGKRSEAEGNLSGMTWEIGVEDGNAAEIYMRFRYQGIEGVEHYLIELRRRGRTDILVIYNMDGNAVAELEKIGR